jgi:uncharacterized protein (TIRG00374 family)
MLKKVLFFFVSLIVGIALFIGVIYSVGWQEFKSAFDIFSGWHGLIILFLTALMLFVGAWSWRIILTSQGYNLAKKEIFRLYLAGFSLSYFFPLFMGGGTGTIFRGYVLREKFFIPWRRGAASLIIERFLEITVSLLVILIGLIFFLSKTEFPLGNTGIFLLLGLIIFTAFIIFLYFKFFRAESIVGFFAKFFSKNSFVNGTAREIEQDIFEFFDPKKAVFWKVVGLAFVKVAIIGIRCWILVLFLGKFLYFPYVFPILAFYFLAMFIPVPTMLGTHEIAQTFAFSALGIGAGLAPAFTLIQRGAEITLALIGLIILFKLGAGLVKTVLHRKFNYFLH